MVLFPTRATELARVFSARQRRACFRVRGNAFTFARADSLRERNVLVTASEECALVFWRVI